MMTDDLFAEARHRASQIVSDCPAKRSRPAMWTGLYTGAFLVIVMLGALVAANRIPRLEPYAFERNAVSYCLFVLVMMIPFFRFPHRPLQLFASGMIGWVMLAGAYDLAGIYFRNLFDILRTPLQVLVEGGVVYGLLAVAAWVAAMILHARRHSIAPRRRRAHDALHRWP